MKIGELSRASGTPVETIRFYEREALLPAPQRTESNYRVYTPAHAERLGFIRQCRHLDMTLDEVRLLLRFRDTPGADCGEVDHLLDAHIGHVAQRIRELEQLEQALRALRAQCGAAKADTRCGILTGIEAAATGHPGKAPGRRHVRGAH
jgi:Cd(II)/Pb(II)-responsive transcriptional regulator